jgi:hypothetical protein
MGTPRSEAALRFLRERGQPVRAERTEQLHRVVADVLPDVGLEAAEEVL